MKNLGMLYLTLLALFSSAAMAHHGPSSTDHFIEHLLLVLAIGLPLFFGFRHLLANKKRDEDR
ncbi:MAG: hypothetical protein ABW104_10680 [Candidatus Thiodiazotropha sp. 6PLUC2]